MSILGSLAGIAVKGPWMWYAVGAGALALTSWGGVQTYRVSEYKADAEVAKNATLIAQGETKTVRLQWVTQVNAVQAAAAASAAEFRAREQAYQAQITKGYQDVAAAQARNDAVVADMRSKLRVQNDTIRAYASGASSGGGTAADTLAAAVHRAETLGDVLAEALRVDGELAEGAESEAANARGLLTAWPRQ